MSEPRAAQATDLTRLLLEWRAGDDDAFARLLPLVYHDLRRVARGQLRGGGRDAVLDTTALVHEAYFRLVDGARVDWQDRGHFLAVAARAMRQVVVEHARRTRAAKRGGGERPVTLDEHGIAVEQQAEQLLAIHQALEHLGRRDPRLVRVAECRFFAGLSAEETAQALGVALRTAQRDWTRARAWLRHALRGDGLGGTAASTPAG